MTNSINIFSRNDYRMSKQEVITIEEDVEEPRSDQKLKGGSTKRKQTGRSQSMFQVKHKKYKTFAQELKAGSTKALKKKTHIGKANQKYHKLVNKLIAEQQKGRVSAVVKGSLIDEDMWMALEREGIEKKAYRAKRMMDQLIVSIRHCIGLAEYVKLSWKHAKI